MEDNYDGYSEDVNDVYDGFEDVTSLDAFDGGEDEEETVNVTEEEINIAFSAVMAWGKKFIRSILDSEAVTHLPATEFIVEQLPPVIDNAEVREHISTLESAGLNFHEIFRSYVDDNIDEIFVEYAKANGITAPEELVQAVQEKLVYNISDNPLLDPAQARFKNGTKIGVKDISGMTINEVFYTVMCRCKPGEQPAADSPVARYITNDDEADTQIYEQGFLPIYGLWAMQNLDIIEDFRAKAEEKEIVMNGDENSYALRAAKDVFKGDYLIPDEDDIRYISSQWITPLPERALKNGSVMTMGLTSRDGRGFEAKSYDEMFANMPEGTVFVDIREYNSSNKSALDFDALSAECAKRGLFYERRPILSGFPPKVRALVPKRAKNGREIYDANGEQVMTYKMVTDPAFTKEPYSNIVDYAKVAQSDSEAFNVKGALDEIENASRNGKHVVILDGHMEAGFGPRGMLVGRELDSRGLNVFHLDNNTVCTQVEMVEKSLRGNQITRGSYKDIHYFSDFSYEGGEETEIAYAPGNRAATRNLPDDWNYGTKVSFSQEPAKKNKDNLTNLKNAARTVAINSDFTVSFNTRRGNSVSYAGRKAAGAGQISIGIKEHPEDLLDPEYIESCAKRIINRLNEHLAYNALNKNGGGIDINSIKFAVIGDDISRLSNKTVEGGATEAELNGTDQKRMIQDGLKLDEPTGLNQDHINAFIFAVLSRVKEECAIGQITTTGNTGVEEAAVLASQRMGLTTRVHAPHGYALTLDNETQFGKTYKDEAMFKNRFRLGLHGNITSEDLKKDIEFNESIQRQQEESQVMGLDLEHPENNVILLTDKQILLLSELGYSNNDIHIINDICAKHQHAPIASATDLIDLLEYVSSGRDAYGIVGGSESLSEEIILEAEKKVNERIAECRKKNISFIGFNNPRYPKKLKDFHDVNVHYDDYEVKESNGEATVIVKKREEHEYAPMFMWYKGNIEALDNDIAAVVSGQHVSRETLNNAETIGKKLSANGFTVASALNPNPQSSGFAAANGAQDSGAVTLYMTDMALDNEMIEKHIDKSVSVGGCAFSTNTDPEQTMDDGKMSQKILAYLSNVAVAIEDLTRAQSMPALLWLPAIANHIAYCIGNDIDKMKEKKKALEKKDVDFIGPNGENLEQIKDKLIEKKITDEEKRQNEEAVEEVAEEVNAKAEEIEPDTFNIEVARYGDRRVYFVPENFVNIREALYRQYGEDIEIDVPENKKRRIHDFDFHNVKLHDNDEGIDTFEGYKGTQLQERKTAIDNIIYNNGSIYSLFNAPEGTPGLMSATNRRHNIVAFSSLVAAARDMQIKFQRSMKIDTDRPVHFKNAIHIEIADNNKEIRIMEGDIPRASVCIDSRGGFKLVENHVLGDDLKEHYQKTAEIFRESARVANGVLDDVTVNSILQDIETALYSSDILIDQEFSMRAGQREEIDEIQQRIDNNFTVIKMNNAEVATADVFEGIRNGYLIDKPTVKRYEKHKAVALINDRIADLEHKLDDIRSSYDEKGRELESITDAEQRESHQEMMEGILVGENEINEKIHYLAYLKTEIAQAQSLTLVSQGTLTAAPVINMDGKKVVLSSEKTVQPQFSSFSWSMTAEVANIAFAVSHDVAVASRTSKKAHGEKRIYTADFDKIAEQLKTLGFKFENKETADAEIRAALNNLQTLGLVGKERKDGSRTLKMKSLDDAVRIIDGHILTSEAINAAIAEIETINSVEKSAKKENEVSVSLEEGFTQTTFEKAKPSEIISNLNKGYYIICRDGLKAYADQDLNIRSGFYADLSEMGINNGVAINDAGLKNILYMDKSGYFKEVCPTWNKEICKPKEGVCVVQNAEGRFNFIDLATKQYISDIWYDAVTNFKEGYAIVEGRDELEGLFNYIDRDGKLLMNNWKPEVTDFRNGQAKVFSYIQEEDKYYKRECIINKNNIVQEDNMIEISAQEFHEVCKTYVHETPKGQKMDSIAKSHKKS